MKAGISFFLFVATVLLSGCSSMLFEGRVADKGKLCTSGRYRIAELVVKPLLGRTKTYQQGLSIVRVVGAMPEETVNAVAVEELPDVFSAEADAIPIRVVVDQGQEDKVSGSWTVMASAFTYGLIPTHLTGGESYRVTVTAFGIADDLWQKAITDQIGRVQHMSNLYYTEPCAKLAQLLCEKTGMKKVFFSNSGAESNECAIKVARKYAAETKGADYHTIVTLKNSFHGRTLTTLSATGQDHYHELFQPLTPGFVHATPNDLDSVEKLLQENNM